MSSGVNVEKIRQMFPCLEQNVYGKPLVYFDSAASSQKPEQVIDEMNDYYRKFYGNVNRGSHYLSEIATQKYNDARVHVAKFLGAASQNEIVFTRSTTEAINLVATCLGKAVLNPGDEIILTEMEHHANIVPWYFLAQEKGVRLKVVPVLDDGTIDLDAYKNLFSKHTKLVAFTHASNTLGTINPIEEMIAIAKNHDAITLIDGAQAVHHVGVDVQKLNVDFYAFSGHKAYGPTGIGALYMKPEWFERLPPYQGGGDMISSVAFDKITFAQGPNKFEAGTPNIAGALGLKRALDFIEAIGLKNMAYHEQDLLNFASQKLSEIKGVQIIGQAKEKVSLISFTLAGVHPHDISSIFDREGIAIRAGHLCSQPLMKRFGINALCRASFAVYNTRQEIEQLICAFDKVFEVFKI